MNYNFLVVNKFMVMDKSFMDKVNDHKLPFVIISVLSPEYGIDEVKIPYGAYCKDHLIVKFHDINDDGSVNSLKPVTSELVPIDKTHAKQIIDFALKWRNEVSNFVVHCEAGMSRSPGVALALSEILNLDKKTPGVYVDTLYNINFHNYKVKEQILKTYYKEYE